LDYIFYHIYVIGSWKKIFLAHLKSIISSGLYDFCTKVYLGVNYSDQDEFQDLIDLVVPLIKIEIIFSRHIRAVVGSTIPSCFRIPSIEHCSIELGESETILRMCEFAKLTNKSDYNCLFLHSKSVTNPDIRKGQASQFTCLSHAMATSMPRNKCEANSLITSSIIHYISNWREISKSLNVNSYHYWIWNIFASRSSFIRHFSLEKWINPENIDRFSDHKFTSLTNRHVFAGFPLKLESILGSLPIKPISKFFNEPYLHALDKNRSIY
jgi:hypothetical protein